jgi:hypothetical protein
MYINKLLLLLFILIKDLKYNIISNVSHVLNFDFSFNKSINKNKLDTSFSLRY